MEGEAFFSGPDPEGGLAGSGRAATASMTTTVKSLFDPSGEATVRVGKDPMEDLAVLPGNDSMEEFLLDSGSEIKKDLDCSSNRSVMLTGTTMVDVRLLPGKATMEEFLVSRRYAKEEVCEISGMDTMEDPRVPKESSVLPLGVLGGGGSPGLLGTAMAEEARSVPPTDPPVAPGAPPPPARLCDVAGVPCPSCRHQVQARHLRYHHALHGAYTHLGFDAHDEAADMSAIGERRRNLVAKRLRNEWSLDTLVQIDVSYDLLRSYLCAWWPFLTRKERQHQACERDSPLPPPQPSSCSFLSVGLCQDRNAAWRTQLEDSYAYLCEYGGRSDAWFIGLFGGEGGATAARLASSELPLHVLEQLVTVDRSFEMVPQQRELLSRFQVLFSGDQQPGPQEGQDGENGAPAWGDETSRRCHSIHQAMVRGFLRMDKVLSLGRYEKSKVRWSGCSAAICLIEAVHPEWSDEEVDRPRASTDLPRETGTVHLANAGDVQIVLCKNGKGYRLTEKHDTSNSNERKRILQAGGHLSKNKKYGLVEGRIQTTRGLGHLGDELLKKCIIPVPYTASVPIDFSCQFLILASSGFWKVLTKDQVISISLQMLSYYSGYFEAVSEDMYVRLSVDSVINRFCKNNVEVLTKADLLQELSINEEELESVERLLEELSTQDQYADYDLSVENILYELLEKKNKNDGKPIMEHLIDLLQSMSSGRISTEESIRALSPTEPTSVSFKSLSPIQEPSKYKIPKKHSTLGVLDTKEHNNRISVENFDKKPSGNLEGNDNRSVELASTSKASANEENDKSTSVDQSTTELSSSRDKLPSVPYSELLPQKEEDNENRMSRNSTVEEQDNLTSVEHLSRLSSREEHTTEEVLPSEEHGNKASAGRSTSELSTREQQNDTRILMKHPTEEEHSDDGTPMNPPDGIPVMMGQSTEELSPDKELSYNMRFMNQEFVELSPDEESIRNDSGENSTKESNNLQESILLTSETPLSKEVLLTPSTEESDADKLNEEPHTETGRKDMNLKCKPTPKITKQRWYEILANLISKRLVQAAKEAGSHGNISVLMLLFPGCEQPYFRETMEDRDVQD